jgi:hypothetical protein
MITMSTVEAQVHQLPRVAIMTTTLADKERGVFADGDRDGHMVEEEGEGGDAAIALAAAR